MPAKKRKIKCKKEFANSCNGGGAVYGLGFIGAAIYFITTSTGFWMGVLGVLKAIVWPAFVVYGLLGFLGL
ncbi:hypothetical protein JXB41_01810 [Candidatus Woesearchaeota archaeon]|nr:hypothetical protein [Candidatus Woesearchaeota archaeon]